MSQVSTDAITESAVDLQVVYAVGRLDDDTQTQESIEAGMVAEFGIPRELAERRYGEARGRRVAWTAREEAKAAKPAAEKPAEAGPRTGHTTTVQDFAAVDEAGAAALLGDEENALIPEGGDVLTYGDGGAGKTTLTTDLAFHLAAGDDWLEIAVPRAVRVLLVENEGPRALFNKKIKGKLAAWAGSALEDRLHLFDEPWAEYSFDDEGWRDWLAGRIREDEIDVLVAGPVASLGMQGHGTIPETRAFIKLVSDVRRKSGRPLAVLLTHHANKEGTASGAWEGVTDTLLHVTGDRGNGHTTVDIEKARWSPEHHNTTIKLAWAAGEGFVVEDDRDYIAEIEQLLGSGPRTIEEIRAPKASDRPGIGAGRPIVKKTLELRGDLFRLREGAPPEGGSAKGKYWELNAEQNALV